MAAIRLAEVQAALPSPDTGPGRQEPEGGARSPEPARQGGQGYRRGREHHEEPKKQARKLAKARKALERLLDKAVRADEKQRLNAPLATIQTAVAAVLAQL